MVAALAQSGYLEDRGGSQLRAQGGSQLRAHFHPRCGSRCRLSRLSYSSPDFSGRRACPPDLACCQVENSPRQRVVRALQPLPSDGSYSNPIGGFAPVSLCYGLAPLALLTESLGRRGFSLSPTFSEASDRTPELISASLPRCLASAGNGETPRPSY